jgi:uncharacterized membrane protein YccC
MWEVLQFSWRLNYSWIKMLLIAIMPGVLISILREEPLWLTSSFIAVCSILPYTMCHNSRFLALANTLLICALIYLVIIAFKANWLYLLVVLLVLALIAGVVDNMHKDFSHFTKWLIIGTVYGGERLINYQLSLEHVWYLLILTLFSVGLVVFTYTKEMNPVPFKWIHSSDKRFIFNFKYLFPVLISVLILHYFKLKEPQWMFWSSLSVVFPDFEDVKLRVKQRFYGVSIGALTGLLIGFLLPYSQIITYGCFIMIMISFRMFKDYFPGFLFRCFFVVLYAGNQSVEIALFRLSNVFIGGIIGLICSLILMRIYQLRVS